MRHPPPLDLCRRHSGAIQTIAARAIEKITVPKQSAKVWKCRGRFALQSSLLDECCPSRHALILRFQRQKRPDRDCIHASPLEAVNGFFRLTDNRFVLVEASVQ